MQLTLPSYATCGHCRTIGKRSEAAGVFGNQHIIDRTPWKDRRDLRSLVGLTRQVLCAVNCDIHLAGEEALARFPP
jgi:hypothetical protein